MEDIPISQRCPEQSQQRIIFSLRCKETMFLMVDARKNPNTGCQKTPNSGCQDKSTQEKKWVTLGKKWATLERKWVTLEKKWTTLEKK
jgi:hypothetical protein